ncbi:hypothetical protein [uncultured Schumannella sp.]|uniref:hypothetical protein n=1 Tax=uncultured Schumannella sp. TaxID=1195956 RepID=UPI0025DE266D|nr:hypothetical protein [uncultured Schumannella sp.]
MSSFDRFSLTIARWLTNVYDADAPAGKSTTWRDVTDKFDSERVAREYAECVGVGELTTNAHLTVFGTAVRLTLAGALLLGAAWVMGQFPAAP